MKVGCNHFGKDLQLTHPCWKKCGQDMYFLQGGGSHLSENYANVMSMVWEPINEK